MAPENKAIFLQLWPKCFINFMAFIELIVVIIMFITELGNVAANFWVTNVFAGGWCGLILFIHIIFSFKSACCSPGPAAAFRAAIVGAIGLIASTALISFDAAFIAQPSTCILTSSCVDNSVSNTTFSYSFQQSFFTVFNSWSPFKSYAQPQVKSLCQTIQLGVGGLGFVICIIYLIVYYSCSSKAKKQVEPAPRQRPGHSVPPPQPYYGPPAPPQPPQPYYGPPAPIQPPPPAQPGYYPSPPPPVVQQGVYPGVPTQRYYQPPAVAWGPQPVPQVQPGVIPYNPNRIY